MARQRELVAADNYHDLRNLIDQLWAIAEIEVADVDRPPDELEIVTVA